MYVPLCSQFFAQTKIVTSERRRHLGRVRQNVPLDGKPWKRINRVHGHPTGHPGGRLHEYWVEQREWELDVGI